jgi:hypothetical protein
MHNLIRAVKWKVNFWAAIQMWPWDNRENLMNVREMLSQKEKNLSDIQEVLPQEELLWLIIILAIKLKGLRENKM